MAYRTRAAVALLAVVGLTVPMTGLAQAEPSETGSLIIPLTDTDGTAMGTAEAGFGDESTGEDLATEHSTAGESVVGSTKGSADSETVAFAAAIEEDGAEVEGATPQSEEPATGVEDLATGALEDEYLLLTDPIAIDDPFAVSGVTWAAGESLPVGSSVEVRTLDGMEWSPWFALETEDAAGLREGTEFNVSGASTGIQVRITQGEGDLPTDLRVDIAYSGEGEERVEEEAPIADILPEPDSLTEQVENPATKVSSLVTDVRDDAPVVTKASVVFESGATTAMPAAATLADTSAATALANVKPRSAWGASESIMTWPVEYAAFQGVIVHHTAGSNSYTQVQVPAVIQGIYRYHAISRGWGDIGYNVLVDKYGGRWEGRTGTLASAADKMAVGGHAAPRNSGTMGVSVMGDYTTLDSSTGKLIVPSDTVQRAISDVSAWKFAVAGVDPRSTSPLTVPLPSEKAINSSLAPGSPLPRIAGHRDVSNTACPGSIYTFMTQIRSSTAASYDSLTKASASQPDPTPTQVPTQTPTPTPTPAPTAPTFHLNDGWTGKANIEFSWGKASDGVLVGDWNGDGKDTIALRRGNLFALATRNPPNAAPAFTVSYGKAGEDVLVGDWDGDGRDTLAVRRGNVFHIKNSISSGQADVVVAYGQPGDVILVGDWDGDGKDTFAVRRGNSYHVKHSMASGPADQVIAYGTAADDVYVGQFSDKITKDSLAVRRGSSYFISYTLHGGEADRTLVYGRAADETLVGDWNGDGADTLGVRRIG